MCDHNICIIPGFEVCNICGLVIFIIINEVSRSHPIGEPFSKKVYTHSTIFKKLFNRLTLQSSPPPLKVFKYLEGKVVDIVDIKDTLKYSPFKCKYYEFLSFFLQLLMLL